MTALTVFVWVLVVAASIAVLGLVVLGIYALVQIFKA